MELGSEFDLDLSRLTDTGDTVFEYLREFHTVYTDSGRSALRLLSERFSGETVLIPDYICDSVPEALPRDCRIVYYPVDRRLRIDMDRLEALIREHKPRFFYLMHYFGVLQPDDIRRRIVEWKERYGLTVIEDTTHSLFTAKLTVGDCGIASLRKWFPIPDGGVLYGPDGSLSVKKPSEKKRASRKVEAMLLKRLYLTEDYDCNAKYRELFVREERAFDHQTKAYGMSDVSRFLLSGLSVSELCGRRRSNAARLLEHLRRPGSAVRAVLGGQGKSVESAADRRPVPASLTVAVRSSDGDVLPALPVYAADRDRLRECLMSHRIYCAVHWPLGRMPVYEDTGWIGRHILSLPMDQRYGEEEIEYLAGCLNACGREDGWL